ncbi:hypothetical protein P7D66_22520, partial [Enterococcus avium]|nr:hypothetical protein [Enterococcus avium]
MYSRNYAIGTSEPRTLVGNGSSQATITTLYQLSEKLIGKKVTISFDLEKSVGTTGQRVMVAVDKTWQNMATINIADVPENGKKRFTITATISAADNGQKLYMQSQPNSAPHLNGSVTISDLKIGDDDNWSPAPEDPGMVGFSHKQYELMNSPDGIVRAETLVSDRGAGIDFEIPVMETFEKKYSYLFIGLTTTDEKIAKYKELVKSVSLLRTDRGSGISNRTNVLAYFSRGYFKYDDTYQYLANFNSTNELKTVTDKLSRSQINRINNEGKYCFRIASANNEDTSQTGVVSNGIVSAFVEVKDIKLIIELETNGRTIIESFIAA